METKKQKKIIICISGVAFLIVAGILIWYFAIKIPMDKAYDEYSNTIKVYNEKIGRYNEVVLEYNEKANQIITANKELEDFIDSAQALIDCGDIPYDSESMTTLNNALKNARNNKCEMPEIYEKRETMETDESLRNAFASEIKNVSETLKIEMEETDSEIDVISNESTALSVADYTQIIAEIVDEKEQLEKSYAIQKQITNPTQDFVLSKLNKVEGVANIACATEENDPNGKLGKDGGYTAQVYFSSPLLGTETLAGANLIEAGTDAGGSIEVYATVEAAETRNTYLSSFDGTIFDSGKHRVLGTMVVRVSTNLTASKQDSFMNSIIEVMIEP